MTWHRYSGWAVYTLLAMLSALFVAWRVLAVFDFAYPLWYELLDINQHIAEYGPQNHYRNDFELTGKAERIRLFAAMVKAIHRQGQGLETLQYHDSAGRSVALFLTEPEIVHLSDVARLLDSLMPAGWCAVAVWLLLTAWLAWRKIALPAISHLLSSLLLLITGMLVIVLLLGPVKVFYQLHEWIFPPGHQWFFYYEDSLMTTLLKAPDLFAPISLLLLVTCILFFTIMLVFVRKLLVEKNLSQAQYSYGKKTKRVVKKIRKR